jgi:hypothetical protein
MPTEQRPTSYLDLTHEIPTDARVNKPFFERRPMKPSKHIGNAAIYLGEARKFAKTHPVDADGLAALLRSQGVAEKDMRSLAVVVRSQRREQGEKRGWIRAVTQGWYSKNQGASVYDPATDDHILFSRAVHVVIDGNSRPNHTLLHEAGHLRAGALGIEGRTLYTERNIRRLRGAGRAALAGFAASEAAAVYGAAEGVPLPLAITAMAAGVLGMAASGFAAKFPKMALWKFSSDEHIAERFASEHAAQRIIGLNVTPTGHQLLVDPHHYGSIVELTFGDFASKPKRPPETGIAAAVAA